MCAATDSKFTNFHKYFMSTYYVPGTVLGTEDTVMSINSLERDTLSETD